LTIECSVLGKTYWWDYTKIEFGMLYDKKHKTTYVFKYFEKYLSFLFSFRHDIWFDLLGKFIICRKGF
jgi:hypothetical protein